MLEFIEFTLGRTLGKLFLIGVFALPALALIGYFGILSKRGRKDGPDTNE